MYYLGGAELDAALSTELHCNGEKLMHITYRKELVVDIVVAAAYYDVVNHLGYTVIRPTWFLRQDAEVFLSLRESSTEVIWDLEYPNV